LVKIGYLSVGYYLVFISIVFYFVGWGGVDSPFPMLRFTLVQTLVISIQFFGLILCLLGYSKNETMSFKSTINIFLVLWGILVMWGVWFYYIDTLEWSRYPGMRSLTIWDHLNYAAREFKGLLWIVSGLVLMIADYIQRTRQAETDSLSKNHTSNWVD
jgi:hypothetical protein